MVLNGPVNTLHFAMHARHSFLSMNTSQNNMPWDFRLRDQFDHVKKLRVASLATRGIMSPIPPPEVVAATSQAGEVRPDFASSSYAYRAMENAHKRSMTEQLSYERKCAYRKWLSIVAVNPMAFEVSRMHILSGPMEYAKGGLAGTINDCLGDKSSSTLHNRAGPLPRYVKFWTDKTVKCFPLEEYRVYDYVKAMETSAPSFPKSLMLSISFATHVLGLVGGTAVCGSKRIDGAVKIHYGKRAKLRQRPPLTPDQVQVLERVVHEDRRPVFDRIMAGYFLMLIYGRLRFSDGQRITSMKLELIHVDETVVGFLECAADRTKTSVTLEKKVRFLPIAVPVQCLLQPPWLPVWNQLREDQGLMSSGRGSEFPVMPAPAYGGGWSLAALNVSAAGEWLRALLNGAQTVGDIRVATHSCKATLLAWAARYGLPHDPRRLLGYHSSTSDKSMLVYSRDAMSAPLRLLIEMINAASAGKFDPSATRSGLIAADIFRTKDGADLDEGVYSDASSAPGSEDEDDHEPYEEEKAVEEIVGAWQVPQSSEDAICYFRHKISRCIHATKDESGSQLMCGRTITTRYEALSG